MLLRPLRALAVPAVALAAAACTAAESVVGAPDVPGAAPTLPAPAAGRAAAFADARDRLLPALGADGAALRGPLQRLAVAPDDARAAAEALAALDALDARTAADADDASGYAAELEALRLALDAAEAP